MIQTFLSRVPRLWLFLLVASVTVVPAAAQEVPLSIDTPVPGMESYDSAIPTPTEVIGHEIGMRHTRPAQAVRYFEAVAEASDRVVLREHGRTYEGRRLIHAIVTDPSNQDNLERSVGPTARRRLRRGKCRTRILRTARRSC